MVLVYVHKARYALCCTTGRACFRCLLEALPHRSMETLDKFRSPSAEGSLKEDLTGLRTPDGDANTTVEDVLREVQLLEKRQYTQSRFGRILRSLEPLLDFLIMYSPAVDMIVQYDPSPSALIWGALKALLKVSMDKVVISS